MPAWISVGLSCRTQTTLKFALRPFRVRLTVWPVSRLDRTPPSFAPPEAMSMVQARPEAPPSEIFTGRTIFRRGLIRRSCMRHYSPSGHQLKVTRVTYGLCRGHDV